MYTDKKLIQGMTGYIRPGEMVLVLGRPGAGCTTFLQAISGRLPKGLVQTGNVLINGRADLSLYNQQINFVPGDDIHIPALTVEETLTIAYELSTRVDTAFRDEEIKTRVANILQLMGLYHVRNTVVGDAMLRGVSGGEKKRVTIAEGLLANSGLMVLDDYSKVC